MSQMRYLESQQGSKRHLNEGKMSLWNLIKNTIIEVIDMILEGLEPYKYMTLLTKTLIHLLSFERDEE